MDMDSPKTRTPMKSVEPQPMMESPASKVQMDKPQTNGQYTPRATPVTTTAASPQATIPASSGPLPPTTTVIPMRPAAAAAAADNRSENRYSEQRYPEQQQRSDPRYQDQQRYPGPDQKYQEQKYPDQQRYPDPRYPDPRNPQQQFTDQRYPEQQRFPDPRFPEPPAGTLDYPPRPPMQIQTPLSAPNTPLDIKSVKSTCQQNLQELIRLQRQRHSFGATAGAGDLEWQIRGQTGVLLEQLKTLQAEVRKMAKSAQNHRWRRWLIGGFIATFVPIIRKLFRRGGDSESRMSSNNTEYAFRKTKGLITRIKDSVLRHGHWASMAFFVFAVLFVFQNEVTFRVSKTIYKRIRKLVGRIEYGDDNISERDLKVFEGWRWRVMLW
ncbi:hypothetical protein PT974_02298 [Cladobotryum mycophilum]|uniref:Uncharacterized protein n=1 Tax=Cladobotryum mycophilum TaxID=491253 RepID=A0ABR0SYX2_9HYPO